MDNPHSVTPTIRPGRRQQGRRSSLRSRSDESDQFGFVYRGVEIPKQLEPRSFRCTPRSDLVWMNSQAKRDEQNLANHVIVYVITETKIIRY